MSRDAEEPPFWKTKSLAQMTDSEWESVCDGCGRCCLNKLEDEDTGKIYFTDVACRLFDAEGCRCHDYENRSAQVPDCVRLDVTNVGELSWLPSTCGYRLLVEGKDLYWWHPLVSGDPDSVHAAGISCRGRVSDSEANVPDEDLQEHIVTWPNRLPKGGRVQPKPPERVITKAQRKVRAK